ncbi:MAG: patatin-like phospholipase family protein [Hydrogenophaga sp.]|nr:patatin-like phospholipase family protein [Hydrogenophaga sp.]
MRLPWTPNRPSLNLALQGGGAHGAFTWGVLDALLEDGRLQLDAISGTSAGAMNAVVLAQGLMDGGTEGARRALRTFWTAVAGSLPFEGAVPTADGTSFRLAPAMQWMLQWTQHLSPEQLNPFDHNPLRELLRDQIDFEALRHHSPVRLFIAATEANTGRLRLFQNPALSLDALLASACLPRLHHSVVIDGQPHWDGGFSANPAVFPLLLEGRTRDILLVLLTPLAWDHTPRTPPDIEQRTMELAFNATFLREMRLYADLRQRLLRVRWWPNGPLERRLLQARFHAIGPGDALRDLGTETKAAAGKRFFERLFALGREQGLHWLQTHGQAVGNRDSVDLQPWLG